MISDTTDIIDNNYQEINNTYLIINNPEETIPTLDSNTHSFGINYFKEWNIHLVDRGGQCKRKYHQKCVESRKSSKLRHESIKAVIEQIDKTGLYEGQKVHSHFKRIVTGVKIANEPIPIPIYDSRPDEGYVLIGWSSMNHDVITVYLTSEKGKYGNIITTKFYMNDGNYPLKFSKPFDAFEVILFATDNPEVFSATLISYQTNVPFRAYHASIGPITYI
jgi:hypothetical protein